MLGHVREKRADPDHVEWTGQLDRGRVLLRVDGDRAELLRAEVDGIARDVARDDLCVREGARKKRSARP